MADQNALSEVLAFFAAWRTKDEMVAAMRERFTPETVWENVGIAKTVGFEEAMKFTEQFSAQLQITRLEVIVHHAASAGAVVLTERTDRLFGPDGACIASIRLMGIFEMEGPRIRAWRDYSDPAVLQSMST